MSRTALLLAFVGGAAAIRMPAREGNLHQQQLEWASMAVNTNCNVTVDTKERTIYLESCKGKYTISKAGVKDAEGKITDSTPEALLCLGNKEAPSDGPALMFAASGAKYLMNDHGGQGVPFDFYLNKHCWAKNNNVQYYLWFGNPQDSEGFMTKKDPDALPCKDGNAGNHYFVIAGMRQLMMEKQNSWIISMDISDVFFTKSMAHRNLLDKYLDTKYDVIGGATGGGTAVFINGAIIAYKNSQWARDFAARWFKNRCGAMNQLAMWNSMFQIWNEENPSFEWSKGTMSSYSSGRSYARKQAGKLITDPVEKKAFNQWSSSGKLTHSLSFPHVLVYGNTGESGKEGVAWRADINFSKDSFVCHRTMNRKTQGAGCNAKKDMCSLPEQCKC